MQLKTHPALKVLSQSHRTTLKDLQQFVGTAAKNLYEEAFRKQLFVSGPIYWIYDGMDGNPDTLFTLDIALPVNGDIPSSDNNNLRELDAFYCLSTIHEGAWEKLPDTYAGLMERVGSDQLSLSGITREMYINIDFAHPENNITEVQLGMVK